MGGDGHPTGEHRTVAEARPGATHNLWKGNFGFSVLLCVTDPNIRDQRGKSLDSMVWTEVLTQCGLWFSF